jgi:hypothetical protein
MRGLKVEKYGKHLRLEKRQTNFIDICIEEVNVEKHFIKETII